MTRALSQLDFEEFFRSVNGGHPPFPWQKRFLAELVERLASDQESGIWPSIVDLPTGSGKTSLIDIAVFMLALEAARPAQERRMPRRIVFVVDRRVVADQAHEHARSIAESLAAAPADGGVLRAVSDALRLYSEGTNDSTEPLLASLLRGGITRDEQWARRPDIPCVISSTVDQVGSRLLFRGYGVSTSMRPIHAGLLGSDALFLLDEVHLSQPFAQTLRSLGDDYQRAWAQSPVPARWEVVELSATPTLEDGAPRRTFALGASTGDFDVALNPTLPRRLVASKPATLVDVVKVSATDRRKANDTFAAACVAQAKAALNLEHVDTLAVVVNRVEAAVAVNRLLEVTGIRTVLLTGRMRPFDREAILGDQLKARLRTGRTRGRETEKLVVVATQCIEAGADFDFDGLVTECASLEALLQRFGRVDRDGALADAGTPAASSILVRSTDLKAESDPVYGASLRATWESLTELASADALDFGISAFPAALKSDSALRSQLEDSPIVLPAHLDAWVQTNPTPTPDPDPKFWLHGPSSPPSDVTVVWRSELSDELLVNALDPASPTLAALRTLVVAAPPGAIEAMSVPLRAVRSWMRGDDPSSVSDVEADGSEDPKVRRSSANGRLALCWDGDSSAVVDSSQIRPGQVLVVPASYGGVGSHGSWDANSTAPVPDLAERAQLVQRRRAVLRLVPGVMSAEAPLTLPEMESDPDLSPTDLLRTWLDTNASSLHGDQRIVAEFLLDALDGPAGARRRVTVETVTHPSPVGSASPVRYLVASAPVRSSRELVLARLESAGTESDEYTSESVDTEPETSSFTSVAVDLDRHLVGVEQWARQLATNCGLPTVFIDDLTLAGRLHDLGKADPRFQSWLRQGELLGTADLPLAKSGTASSSFKARNEARHRSGYPIGARHELMSVAMVQEVADLQALANDWQLVLYLVGSHHGWCRPFPPSVIDASPVSVMHAVNGVALEARSDHGLESLDSGIPDRFWRMVRRYGWHRLAWLESILRLADHRESEEEQLLSDQSTEVMSR